MQGARRQSDRADYSLVESPWLLKCNPRAAAGFNLFGMGVEATSIEYDPAGGGGAPPPVVEDDGDPAARDRDATTSSDDENAIGHTPRRR